MSRTRRAALLLALLPTVFAPAARAADEKESPKNPAFYLKNHDRVVFYGDSITDQRIYTTYVETYVKTRFPNWNVTFVHSGWGGDRVTGGGGGPIDMRLSATFRVQADGADDHARHERRQLSAVLEAHLRNLRQRVKHIVDQSRNTCPGSA